MVIGQSCELSLGSGTNMTASNVINPKWLDPKSGVKKGRCAQAITVNGARVLRIGTRPIEVDVKTVRECMKAPAPTRGVNA